MNSRIITIQLLLLTLVCGTLRAGEGGLEIVSAKLGLIDYDKPGLRSGDFAIKEVSKIPQKEKYFGWVVEVKCPPGMEDVKWTGITYLPGRYESAKPGVSADDATITVSNDRKSFATRRATVCRDGIARIEDLYTREEGLPTGEWKIAVWSGKQLLAEFRFTLL